MIVRELFDEFMNGAAVNTVLQGMYDRLRREHGAVVWFAM